MKIIHIVPGLDDSTCGIAVAAKMVARRQSASGKVAECVDFLEWTQRQIADADEVWVHSMWTPGVMRAAWTAFRLKKKLIRMPHGCMDPVKRRHRWWKKMWVTPIERWLFARSDRVVVTCPDEVEWVRKFDAKIRNIEFLSLGDGASDKPLEDVHNPLRLLFVGRLHPLKGVEFLLEAMKDIEKLRVGALGVDECVDGRGEYSGISELKSKGGMVCSSTSTKDFDFSMELKVIGKDEGEEDKLRRMATEYGLEVEFCGVVSEEDKEKDWEWCDVLVLPTLSENFGLVVAEALERGKRVITTDGAPVWGEGRSGGVKSGGVGEWVSGGVGEWVSGEGGSGGVVSRVERVEGEGSLEVRVGSLELEKGEIWCGYGGRLLYLKGYRDGTREMRVELLKKAIMKFGV